MQEQMLAAGITLPGAHGTFPAAPPSWGIVLVAVFLLILIRRYFNTEKRRKVSADGQKILPHPVGETLELAVVAITAFTLAGTVPRINQVVNGLTNAEKSLSGTTSGVWTAPIGVVSAAVAVVAAFLYYKFDKWWFTIFFAIAILAAAAWIPLIHSWVTWLEANVFSTIYRFCLWASDIIGGKNTVKITTTA